MFFASVSWWKPFDPDTRLWVTVAHSALLEKLHPQSSVAALWWKVQTWNEYWLPEFLVTIFPGLPGHSGHVIPIQGITGFILWKEVPPSGTEWTWTRYWFSELLLLKRPLSGSETLVVFSGEDDLVQNYCSTVTLLDACRTCGIHRHIFHVPNDCFRFQSHWENSDEANREVTVAVPQTATRGQH